MHVEVSDRRHRERGKTAFCLNTSTGTMTFVPGVETSGTPCGLGKSIINVYIEG